MEPVTAVAETCCCLRHWSTLPSHRTRSYTWFRAPSWRALQRGSQLPAMEDHRQQSMRHGPSATSLPLDQSYHRTVPLRSATLRRESRAVCAIESHRGQTESCGSGGTTHLARTASRCLTPETSSCNTIQVIIHQRKYHLTSRTESIGGIING